MSWRTSVVALLLAAGVCRAQTGGAARVLSLTGQVSVLRDGAPWALNAGDQVEPRQIIVTGPDSYALLEVADGSRFEVFASARVTFRSNPGDWRDLVEVWMGRIKAYIHKAGGQPNRNRVRTPTALISVRGTIFDVVVEDEDATTLVSVEEGQVAVAHLLIPRGERLLGAGDSVRVYRNLPLTARAIQKGAVAQGALRVAAETLYDILWRRGGGAGGGVSGPAGAPSGAPGPPAPADRDPGDAPPPPPPPPPPPK